MKKHPDYKIIKNLGGSVAVCELLGIDPRNGGHQRVYNWGYRGIPVRVKYEHPHVFKLAARIEAKESGK